MTFVFLGMFVASSAGEDSLQQGGGGHPPAPAGQLRGRCCGPKIRVLVEVSLWLAGAFNLAGLFVGIRRRGQLALSARPCYFHRAGGAVLHGQRGAGLSALPALVRTRAAGRLDDHRAGAGLRRGGPERPDSAAIRVSHGPCAQRRRNLLVDQPAAAGVVCRSWTTRWPAARCRLLAAGGAGGGGHRGGSVARVRQTGAGLRNRTADAQRNRFHAGREAAAAAGSTGWSTCRR